jgi:hypothetical protein
MHSEIYKHSETSSDESHSSSTSLKMKIWKGKVQKLQRYVFAYSWYWEVQHNLYLEEHPVGQSPIFGVHMDKGKKDKT